MADVAQGVALIERFDVGAVITDKGYDHDALVPRIEGTGTQAILPRNNRNTLSTVDWHRYNARNPIERFSVVSSNSVV